MTDSTRRTLTDQMNATVNHYAEIFAAIDTMDKIDGQDAMDYLAESVLEIIDERGREFAVVVTCGGPHIEAVSDGWRDFRWVGRWGGETVTLHHGSAERLIDFFIDRPE